MTWGRRTWELAKFGGALALVANAAFWIAGKLS